MREAKPLCSRLSARIASAALWRVGRSLPMSSMWRTRHTPQFSSFVLPTTTSLRAVHSPPVASPESQLAREVHSFVPPTFTALPQISRQVPPELMERIASPSCGGLRQLLSRHPDWFETKEIGRVHVARRRTEHLNDAEQRHPRKRAVLYRSGGPASAQSTYQGPGRGPQAGVAAQAEVSAAELALMQLFPDFLVPVRALWTTVPEREEAEAKERVLKALQENRSPLLIFRAHPEHRDDVCGPLNVGSGGRELGTEKEKGCLKSRTVLESGYVQRRSLSPDAPSAGPEDVRARLAEYEVQPYEWYRVARVLPTVTAEVPFEKALFDAATALLPAGRDVWQVLLSAPHLFTVRYDDAKAATCTATEAPPTTTSPVRVRFNLHPRYIPSGVLSASEASLLRELEDVAVNRDANRCGLTTRQRRHRRKLQQQLTYLRNPTPYFDTHVLAQHLFDLLPLRDGVHQSALLGALPPHAVSAFPQNVTDLLKERTDLFRLSDARHGVLVQRADAPANAEERTTDSVTGDEILQCIFACYSTRTDPRAGTTISRNLSRLPRLLRERLFAMQDVVAELLCRYPEKVEVLPSTAQVASSSSSVQQDTEQDERAKRELQNVRGRRDFLVPFRFVGEWEGKLMEKYTRQQEKEFAKSGARQRTSRSQRPRY